jgi:hypothetical protein
MTANDCIERDPTEWTWYIGVEKNKKGEKQPAKTTKSTSEWLALDIV